MLKQILILLFVLIVTLMTGVISLVAFVDPNGFRTIISERVKDKTGYQLTINGDLRWHIWPQVSILTDSIILSDEGAMKPVLTADNMRLDVELLPLFRKKLSVKNVLIKSAVINITDDSQGFVAKGVNTQTATINQLQSTPIVSPLSQQNKHWSFVLNKFMVADSTVVIQKNSEFITFRNINLSVEKKSDKIASIDLNGNINRNQQNIIYQLNGDLDLNQYPDNATLKLAKLDYDYADVGVPTGKLKGSISGTIHYQASPKMIESQDLNFSVNNNVFLGSVKTYLSKKNYTELALNTEKIDVTPFIISQTQQTSTSDIQPKAPVITINTTPTNELNFLNHFDATLLLNAKALQINKTTLNNVNVDAKNQDGVTALTNISFDLDGGHIKANGTVDGKLPVAAIKLNTSITNMDLDLFSNHFGIKSDLKGLLNATGDLSTNTVKLQNIIKSLNGKLAISIEQAQLEGINISDIIQNTVSQYTKNISIPNSQLAYTELNELSADANLKNGNMQLSSIKAATNNLDVNGSGNLDLAQRNLDVNLTVKIHDNGSDKNEIIAKLQKIAIPFRIYGEFPNLNYQVNVEQLVKELFTDKLQLQFEKLRNRIKNRE